MYVGGALLFDVYVRLFHITTRSSWEQAVAIGVYRAPSLATDGFIHLSGEHQWLATANRFFRGERGLALLAISAERLRCEVRYEPADRDVFPHLYGPLNVDAVVEVFDLPVAGDGTIGLPAAFAR